MALRDIIEEIHEMGYRSATFMPENDKDDIRITLQREVSKYRTKFLSSLIIQIPIMILMWVMPYTRWGK